LTVRVSIVARKDKHVANRKCRLDVVVREVAACVGCAEIVVVTGIGVGMGVLRVGESDACCN
jgi:hypothetical protein